MSLQQLALALDAPKRPAHVIEGPRLSPAEDMILRALEVAGYRVTLHRGDNCWMGDVECRRGERDGWILWKEESRLTLLQGLWESITGRTFIRHEDLYPPVARPRGTSK